MYQYFTIAQGAAAPAASAPAKVQTAVQTAAPAKVQTAAQTAAPAAAQPQRQPSFMDGFGGMIPIIIIFGAMFYLMWRSQSKERKRREEMLSSIKAGDKVVTVGGIFGVVESVSNENYKLKIADNVRIEVTRTAVSSKVEEKPKDGAAEKK